LVPVPALKPISDSMDVAICRWAELAFSWRNRKVSDKSLQLSILRSKNKKNVAFK